MDYKNNLREWLNANVSRNTYQEIYNKAAAFLEISEVLKSSDLGNYNVVPKARRIAWVEFIKKYNPSVTIDDLFPKVEEPTNA